MTTAPFELHVLVGEPALFGPDIVEMTDLLPLLGVDFDSAPIGWIGRNRRYPSHDLLAEGEDRRVAVMARGLAVDFGGHLQPCLLLPGLASASRRSAICDMLAALAGELRKLGEATLIVLHGVELAGRATSRPLLQAVLSDLTARGLAARLPENPILVVQEDGPAGRVMSRNLFVSVLAKEVAAQAADLGLACAGQERLVAACMAALGAWSQLGLSPSAAAGSDSFKRLASTMLHHLIAAPAGQPSKSAS